MTGSDECKKCGVEVVVPVKSWVLKPKKGGAAFRIEFYDCPKCGNKWRRAVRIR